MGTLSVLAAEGFLPGYGLEIGAVRANAQMPRHLGGTELDLPRPPATALREYVPGNIIYANGQRFVTRYHQLDAIEAPIVFQVDGTTSAVMKIGAPAPSSTRRLKCLSGS